MITSFRLESTVNQPPFAWGSIDPVSCGMIGSQYAAMSEAAALGVYSVSGDDHHRLNSVHPLGLGSGTRLPAAFELADLTGQWVSIGGDGSAEVF